MVKVLIAIPSYDRPEILGFILKKLVNMKNVHGIVVVADASSQEILKAYKEILSQYSGKITAELHFGRRGSAKARNALLELATRNANGIKYVLLMDDDYLLSHDEVLQRMVDDLEILKDVGVVGGRVINLQKRVIDPDFSLNVPVKVVDWLTKITGFIFGSSWRRISYGESTTPFMLIRSNLLGKISYDENCQGTGYREETDLQRQVIRLGFKILSDDRAYVYHFTVEEGGCRPNSRMCSRMYWKARNHTYFIQKWQGHQLSTSLWYTFLGIIILILYRPSCFREIFRGLQHGYKVARNLGARRRFLNARPT